MIVALLRLGYLLLFHVNFCVIIRTMSKKGALNMLHSTPSGLLKWA